MNIVCSFVTNWVISVVQVICYFTRTLQLPNKNWVDCMSRPVKRVVILVFKSQKFMKQSCPSGLVLGSQIQTAKPTLLAGYNSAIPDMEMCDLDSLFQTGLHKGCRHQFKYKNTFSYSLVLAHHKSQRNPLSNFLYLDTPTLYPVYPLHLSPSPYSSAQLCTFCTLYISHILHLSAPYTPLYTSPLHPIYPSALL